MKTLAFELEVLETTCDTTGMCECVAKLLEPQSSTSNSIQPPASYITEVIFGTRQTRLGPGPTSEMAELMTKRIQRFMDSGYPIEMLVMWGAQKAYGQVPNRYECDVYDLLALRRFMNLNAQVVPIYSPGLRVVLIREDVGKKLISTTNPNTLGELMRTYEHSMIELSEAMDLSPWLEITNESELMESRLVPEHEFVGIAHDFARSFAEYWHAAKGVDDSVLSTLWEYTKLENYTGFSGGLSHEQMSHYMARAINAYPDLTEDERIYKVCLYLGLSRARAKTGFIRGSFTDKFGFVDPIRASFVPYPPGTPSSMMAGRVDYKVKDSKRSHLVSAPWTGIGCLEHDAQAHVFDPIFHQPREYNSCDHHSTSLILHSDSGHAKFFADVVVGSAS